MYAITCCLVLGSFAICQPFCALDFPPHPRLSGFPCFRLFARFCGRLPSPIRLLDEFCGCLHALSAACLDLRLLSFPIRLLAGSCCRLPVFPLACCLLWLLAHLSAACPPPPPLPRLCYPRDSAVRLLVDLVSVCQFVLFHNSYFVFYCSIAKSNPCFASVLLMFRMKGIVLKTWFASVLMSWHSFKTHPCLRYKEIGKTYLVSESNKEFTSPAVGGR